jgi:hypothetical protein
MQCTVAIKPEALRLGNWTMVSNDTIVLVTHEQKSRFTSEGVVL